MPISTDDLLSLVGCSPEAADVDQWLTAQRIYDRPQVGTETNGADNARDTGRIDEVERHSLALIYDRKAIYRLLVGKPDGLVGDDPGDFVLREVALFGPGVQDYRGYSGPLPFGLQWGASKEHCAAVMGTPLARRTIHELTSDLWALEGWIVNASYQDDALAIVHLRRLNKYDRRMLGVADERETQSADRPPADSVLKVVGRVATDVEVRDALSHIDWSSDLFDFSNAGEISKYVQAHGVTLYLGGKDVAPSVITGIRLNRQGDMDSLGYSGRLPFGIEFHTTPTQLEAMVGRKPDRLMTSADTGAMRWSFPGHDLHVMYSLIDFQVYRVSLFLADAQG